MRLALSATIASLFALGLLGCGSSADGGIHRGDALAPAPLATPEEALNASAYLALAARLDEAALAFQDIDSPLTRKALSYARKVTLNDFDCPDGGQLDFTDGNRDDLLVFDFDNCADEGSTLRGHLELECLAGNFSSGQDSCSNLLLRFGAGNDALLAFASDGQELGLRGNYRVQTAAPTTISLQNLEIEARDTASDLRVISISEAFSRDIESSENGNRLVNVGGSLGVAAQGPEVVCATGKVLFTTLDRIVINTAGEITGGQLRLSNDNSQTATIVFNSDGSVRVTTSGGTETFSRTRFGATCALGT